MTTKELAYNTIRHVRAYLSFISYGLWSYMAGNMCTHWDGSNGILVDICSIECKKIILITKFKLPSEFSSQHGTRHIE